MNQNESMAHMSRMPCCTTGEVVSPPNTNCRGKIGNAARMNVPADKLTFNA